MGKGSVCVRVRACVWSKWEGLTSFRKPSYKVMSSLSVKMEFPLSAMLLLCLGPMLTRESTNGKEDVMVYQTSDSEVTVGENASIQCCWRAINQKIFTVNWSKNETRLVQQNGPFGSDREACGGLVFPSNETTCVCTSLTLHSVTRNHTGLYVCKVNQEKPVYQLFTGNGTMITVMERQSHANPGAASSPPSFVVGALAAAMAAVVVVALVGLWRLRRRQELDRAARVIFQDPHGDSEVDGTSTSSSKGSTQWCQVPMYESFNYFQPVESKSSG